MTQVEILRDALLYGVKVDRVNAFQIWGIADLRSRLSDVKRIYGIVPKRETKPGKRYLQYWIESPKSLQV
jgi:hypothetical protein